MTERRRRRSRDVALVALPAPRRRLHRVRRRRGDGLLRRREQRGRRERQLRGRQGSTAVRSSGSSAQPRRGRGRARPSPGGDRASRPKAALKARRGGFGAAQQLPRRGAPRAARAAGGGFRVAAERGRAQAGLAGDDRAAGPHLLEDRAARRHRRPLLARVEGVHSLTGAEVYDLEATVRILMEMCVEAGDHIIEHNLFSEMGIPGWAVPDQGDLGVRAADALRPLRLRLRPRRRPKLLEFNADTPTSLIETAVQWHWVQDVFGRRRPVELRPRAPREALEGAPAPRLPGTQLHLLHTSAERSGEDFMTVGYLAKTARQAGLTVSSCRSSSSDDHESSASSTPRARWVRSAFKLYPWKWMLHEEFSEPRGCTRMGVGMGKTLWIEPIWKMLWSNKGCCPSCAPVPDHPNLLPAYFEHETRDTLTSFVRKLLLAREGADTTVVIDGYVADRGPRQGYGGEGPSRSLHRPRRLRWRVPRDRRLGGRLEPAGARHPRERRAHHGQPVALRPARHRGLAEPTDQTQEPHARHARRTPRPGPRLLRRRPRDPRRRLRRHRPAHPGQAGPACSTATRTPRRSWPPGSCRSGLLEWFAIYFTGAGWKGPDDALVFGLVGVARAGARLLRPRPADPRQARRTA